MPRRTEGSRALAFGVTGILVLSAVAVAWFARPPAPTRPPIPGSAPVLQGSPGGGAPPGATTPGGTGAAASPALPKPPAARTPPPAAPTPSPGGLPGAGVPVPGGRAPAPPAGSPAVSEGGPGERREGPTPGEPREDERVVVLGGAGAETVAAEANRLLGQRVAPEAAYRAPSGHRVRVRGSEALRVAGDEVGIELVADGVRLRDAPAADLADDPVADLVPPAALVGEAFLGVPLPVGPGDRPRAVAALAALLLRDASTARVLLAAAGDAPGVRLLDAWAALLGGDLPAVHRGALGWVDDPALGPTARLAVGAALRVGESPLEAAREFEAALAARPAWPPAHRLAAEAYESPSLRLDDRAAAHWAAAHAALPTDPVAALGTAYHLAATTKDGAAARAVLDALTVRRPDLVAVWRLLAWVRAQEGSLEGARGAVEALERVAERRPREARAWADLGGARWEWAERGGGLEAVRAAAEAYARQTTLDPEDALAWFHRGGALHRLAREGEPERRGAAAPPQARQARTCYARALALGLEPRTASRVFYDLGLLADAGADAGPEGAPTATEAFRAALDLDPGFDDAARALVAAHLAARDAPGARAAILRLPAGVDANERGVLEAGVLFLAGDAAAAGERLRSVGALDLGNEAVGVALGRALLVLGHPRAALVALPTGDLDLAALVLRARAHAALHEPEAFEADLVRIEALDPAEARRLRRR